jgi:hypothetical protein
MTRLAKALNSSDLAHEEFDCDVDMLQASGLTAIRRNLGILIIEAKEGAAGEGAHAVARIKDLERGLAPRVQRIARRCRIQVDIQSVAEKIAKELILDRCPVCQGRGTIPMKYDGQRMVAVSVDLDSSTQDVDCHVCLGSGAAKRDYHGRAKSAGLAEYTKKLGEFWDALLTSCLDAEHGARTAMWRRLNDQH